MHHFTLLYYKRPVRFADKNLQICIITSIFKNIVGPVATMFSVQKQLSFRSVSVELINISVHYFECLYKSHPN